MGRPPSDFEDYQQWQQRLKRYQTHGRFLGRLTRHGFS